MEKERREKDKAKEAKGKKAEAREVEKYLELLLNHLKVKEKRSRLYL